MLPTSSPLAEPGTPKYCVNSTHIRDPGLYLFLVGGGVALRQNVGSSRRPVTTPAVARLCSLWTVVWEMSPFRGSWGGGPHVLETQVSPEAGAEGRRAAEDPEGPWDL